MFRSNALRIAKRSIHTVPTLPSQEILLKNGIPGVYSVQQLQTVWFDNQLKLTTELNTLISGTPDESRTPLNISLISCKDKTRQRVFNLSSNVFNNHFCIEQLIPIDGGDKNKNVISRALENKINETFGGLDGFKNDVLELSNDIVGQGYIFLIEDEFKQLSLKPINNNGTPFKFSSNLSLDLNGPIDLQEYKYLKDLQRDFKDGVEDYSLPIWGINLWDFAYLNDYGVKGKKKYVENVVDHTNWDVVNKRCFRL